MCGRCREPLRLPNCADLFSYVDGNPLTGTDPKGLANSAATFWMRGKNSPTQPSKAASSQACSCKNTSLGAYAQFGVGASVQAFIAGVSGSVGAAASTSGQACVVRTVCGRLGPGFYAGVGGNVGGGAVFGSTDSLGGLSVGLGADVGAGASIGGQASMGVNPGPSVSSMGGVKGHGGLGAGIGAGRDICYSWVDCTACE